jgi:hypothetical protein
LQHGKWVTANATIGGNFVSATLDERNEFMDVSREVLVWDRVWQGAGGLGAAVWG